MHKINKFIIVTSELIISIANYLSSFLNDLNYNTSIKINLTKEDCEKSNDNIMYIILHLDNYPDYYPKKYIFYQIEQASSSHFTDKYINYLINSTYVWDFSIKNFDKYKDKIEFKNFFYMPLPFYCNNKNKINNNYEYDIFFYGAFNERRNKILEELKKKYNIIIGFGINGDNKNEYIKKSKIILNLHYYDNACLETCRINEILPYNRFIISERSINDDFNEKLYDKFIKFIDIIDDNLSNINNLYDTIDNLLNNNLDNNIINEKKKLSDKMNYFIKKNLLSIKKQSIKTIDYDLYENIIYCLHLIETPFRFDTFNKQKYIPSIQIFPAIKYSPGWVGCGLSYVNLMYNAKRCNLPYITVCEDDCEFSEDFEDKYAIIIEYLSKLKKWDIFVGCIAGLPNDSNIVSTNVYKNITFVELNKMHSMVFNIYNKSSYDKIINWINIMDWDKPDDNFTIDQYIKISKMKIITTYPFEFRCTNTRSTLWGVNLYDSYNKMFDDSLNLLNSKINKKLISYSGYSLL